MGVRLLWNIQFYIFFFWVPLNHVFFQVTKLFEALDKEGEIQDAHNKEEGQALINQEGTEMTSIPVPETD